MRAIQAVHCPTTCEAIQSSKETKVASLNTGDKRFGSVGAMSVAAMVAVTSALTMCDLIYKQESLGMGKLRESSKEKAGFSVRDSCVCVRRSFDHEKCGLDFSP